MWRGLIKKGNLLKLILKSRKFSPAENLLKDSQNFRVLGTKQFCSSILFKINFNKLFYKTKKAGPLYVQLF